MPGDNLVGEITVYYRPPGGEEGSSFSVGGEYGVMQLHSLKPTVPQVS